MPIADRRIYTVILGRLIGIHMANDFDGALLMTSHDRDFMNRVVTHISCLELPHLNHQLVENLFAVC